MGGDNAPATVEALLRSAAAADAAGARALLARIDGVRLLELTATQAELAVDGERPRPAGIDAVGDLARAAIEVMDLPQDASLDLEEETFDPPPPTVTGWELVTVEPDELEAATMTAPVPSWALALVAFADHPHPAGGTLRRTVAAAADGRLLAAELRLTDPLDDAELLTAVLSRDADDLGDDAALAAALRSALASAGRGI